MNNHDSEYNELVNEELLDEIYNEAEKYLEDYDFQNFFLPLLNPDSFTIEKIHNLKKVLKYYKEEMIFLPLIDDPRYEFIKNYKEFEFSNCIAYEMAIRTDEFQKAKFLYMIIQDIQSMYPSSLCDILNNIKESSQYFHKDIQNILSKYIARDMLEKDFNHTLLNKILVDLIKELENSKIILKDLGILNLTSFLGQDMIDLTGENFVLIDQIQRDLHIKDFDNGLELLIKFYLTKESIYIKNNTELKFDKIKNSNIEEILNKILDNTESYYLEINSNIIQLSKNMTISMLDREFKDLLKKHYNKYKYIDIQPNYTRPSLHFIDAKIVNLPINLNFSKNELKALVSKIKDDYDNKESRIKTPLEILGEKLEKFIKPNSEEVLVLIKDKKEALKRAKKDNDEKGIHNIELDLKEANEEKSALELFKSDLAKFVRMYEFLSQIVDYEDKDLLKLNAFLKGLIPNLKTVNTSDDVDISLIELSRYRLFKQKEEDIKLEGGKELKGISDVGTATPKDPEKIFLSKIVEAMNSLFKGDFTDDDVYNYAKTISDKVKEDTVVIEQITNNTKEQAMLGGFADKLNDAVIESLDAHQNMATQVLSEERIRKGLANIVYDFIIKGMNQNRLNV